MTKSTFVGSSKSPWQEPDHGDVHADEFAGIVFEVPGRIGTAGADHQLAAIEDRAQQAVRGCLGCRPLNVDRQRATGIGDVAKGVKAPRSTTYTLVHSLVDAGLLETTGDGNRVYFGKKLYLYGTDYVRATTFSGGDVRKSTICHAR